MKKKKIKWCFVAIIIIIYIARVYYVTVSKAITYEQYQIGEDINMSGYSVCVEDIKAYDVEGFFATYPTVRNEYYTELAYPGAKVRYMMVCTVSATCQDSGMIFDFSSITLKLINQYYVAHPFISESMTGHPLLFENIKKGEKVTMQMVFPIQNIYLSKKHTEEFDDLELKMYLNEFPVCKYIQIGRARDYMSQDGE